MLGMIRVAEGSNEIPAVQELLDLSGAIVTADSAHCQKLTAQKMLSTSGDYLLAVKGIQLHLMEDLAACFAHLERHPAAPKEWQTAAPGRATGFNCSPEHVLALSGWGYRKLRK